MNQFKVAEKKKSRGLWPVYGLVMALAAGAIAYVLGPSLSTWFQRRAPAFNVGTFTPEQVDLFFSALIFVAILGLGSLLVAVAAPRKKSNVKETDLVKERKEMQAEQKARRKRRLELEHKMRQQNQRME
jgi:hypothetical protein